jgi:hypothetical protein
MFTQGYNLGISCLEYMNDMSIEPIERINRYMASFCFFKQSVVSSNDLALMQGWNSFVHEYTDTIIKLYEDFYLINSINNHK